ncbi:XRE family transcriptional regulator [Roseibium denhamense]|uniref:Transcriptional regulator, XRE family with cupin sensor n=1 Tax=Roseibium denhamense TaxID=76305 RepID=A0ABY1NUV5_9HYPH|nr:XRE family transcriptional regulator [Roseibium denhamense]MTI05427.1 XRE family transcriptional regulator [Roseibium denhamense]SMP18688.1 transcriptional regulator, XRE family with cupin sensor [Roseibium denhamense]
MADNDILARLPDRLKKARRTQGLSLEAVEKLSGVSRSMVSQIERGESNPTVATLLNLTRALNVDFAGLLGEEAAEDRVEIQHEHQTPALDRAGDGCKIRILSPPQDTGRFEVYELIFAEDGKLKSKPHERGTREQLVAEEGTLEVTSGAATGVIKKGDTARYAADVPHCISAVGGPARAILMVVRF